MKCWLITVLSLLLTSCGGLSIHTPDEAVHYDKVHTAYFEPGSAHLKAVDRARLAAIAADLFANPTQRVSIIGHADEKGGSGYNMILGWRRAHAASKTLQEMGIVRYRISELSYGSEMPIDQHHTDSAWKHNRRVELYTLH